MSDEVREPRVFEPPPWEQERFEASRSQDPDGGSQATVAAEPTPSDEETETSQATAGAKPARTDESRSAPPDPADLDLMMMRLEAQEPDAAEPVRKAGTVAAWLVVLVGVGLLLAAGIAAVRGLMTIGGFGVAGVTMLAVLGLAVAGAGGWILMQTYRQRGA
jgi:hypothetical protein